MGSDSLNMFPYAWECLAVPLPFFAGHFLLAQGPVSYIQFGSPEV